MKDMNIQTQTQRTPHRINLFSTLFPHRAGQGPVFHHHATGPGQPGQMEKHTQRPGVTAES